MCGPYIVTCIYILGHCLIRLSSFPLFWTPLPTLRHSLVKYILAITSGQAPCPTLPHSLVKYILPRLYTLEVSVPLIFNLFGIGKISSMLLLVIVVDVATALPL